MKKNVLVIALAFGVSGAFAQDLTSKKGEPILPEAGDWAISMNIDPVFEFVGNAFSGATTKNAAPGVGFLNSNNTIIGKKFIDEKSAYRALIRIGFGSQTTKAMIAQPATPPVYPAVPAMVEDKMKVGSTIIGLGAGKEWRRGKTRLQGYYGADAMIWLAMGKTKYDYGNALAPTANPAVTVANSTNFGTGNIGTDTYGGAARTTEVKNGMTFGIGVRGFIGAEYFIFPKIAIGAEYGWGLGFQMQGKGKTTKESINATTVGTQETETSGSSKVGIDTDINQGTMFGFKGSNTGTASLRATFHF